MDPIDISLWPLIKDMALPSLIINQVVIDSRQISKENALFVALKGRHFDGHTFVQDAIMRGAKCCIVDKNFSWDTSDDCIIKVDDPLRALQSLSHFYRKKKKALVVAVTGSQGKTMFKDMLLHILKASKQVFATKESFNSQIGVALSLLDIEDNDEIALIEAGVSKEEEMQYLADIIEPHIAIITSLKENASSLPSKESIVCEKCRLLEKVHAHNPIIGPKELKKKQFMAKFIAYDEDNKQFPHAKKIMEFEHKTIKYSVQFPDGSSTNLVWPTPFPEAIDLINAVIKTAYLLDVPKQELIHSLNSYEPQPMQVEIWSTLLGNTFINHTYGKTASSIANALEKLNMFANSRKFMVFGFKKDKVQEVIDDVEEAAKNYGVEKVIFFENGLINQAFQNLLPLLNKDDAVLIQSDFKIPLEDILVLLGDSREGNRLQINLCNVYHNIKKLKGNSKVMAMVKANAYGTDNALLAKYLNMCSIDLLGVAHPDEALVLRAKGIKQDIFVIHASIDEVNKIISANLQVAVSSIEMVHAIGLLALEKKRNIKVHLHVDTGMTRLGCRVDEILKIAQAIKHYSSLTFEGLMTHFACADSVEENLFTSCQIDRFRNAIKILKENDFKPTYIHASNSSAVMRKLLPEGNLIRIGLGMYGISNIGNDELLNAITLSSKIVGINICNKGDTISYGRSFTVQRDKSIIAIVPLGYFDGLHRNYSGKSYVLIRGQRAPMVGTICMDFMMIDVTDIKEVKVGDSVLVFGKDSFGFENPIESFAKDVGTCTHELITCLGPRIQRIFIEN